MWTYIYFISGNCLKLNFKDQKTIDEIDEAIDATLKESGFNDHRISINYKGAKILINFATIERIERIK